MRSFKYETHAHTSETSRCSRIKGAELAGLYKSLGYAGLCITDHFFNGNTTVPKNSPWEERVELFCKGYENAKIEGDKTGLDVFFAWEYSFFGTDYLTYGLDKAWLLAHPDILELSVPEYCALVRSDGGLIIQAHPFREAAYIEMLRLSPRDTDGVEIFNAGRIDEENERAAWYAESYGLLKTAGSDIHSAAQGRFGGLFTKHRADDINSLIAMIKSGDAKLFISKSKTAEASL